MRARAGMLLRSERCGHLPAEEGSRYGFTAHAGEDIHGAGEAWVIHTLLKRSLFDIFLRNPG